MMGSVGLLQLIGLAAVGFAAMTSVVCALAIPSLRAIRRAAPRRRVRLLTAWAAAPAVTALVLVALCLAPSVLHRAGLADDHCHDHDDAHVHLCLVHPPPSPGGVLGWLLVCVAGAVVMRRLGGQICDVIQTTRDLRALRATGSFDAAKGVRWLDAAVPVSMAVGMARPEVLISHGLRSQLSRAQLDAVIAHERAHLRRRDSLRLALVRGLASLQFPRARRALLAELALACEQVCDEEAANAVGGRLQVAEAILVVERLSGRLANDALMAPAFAGSDVRARVERLLQFDAAEVPAPRRVTAMLWAGALLVGLAASAEPLHHATETFLAVLR